MLNLDFKRPNTITFYVFFFFSNPMGEKKGIGVEDRRNKGNRCEEGVIY